MPEHHYARLGPHDSRIITQVAELINGTLGQGNCKPDQLVHWLPAADRGIFTVHATTTGTLVGAATVRILDDDTYVHWRTTKRLNEILPADPPSAAGRRIAYGDDLTVRSGTRYGGIGSTLVTLVTSWLTAEQVTDFYAPLWNPRSLARAHQIARRRKSTIVAELPDYWTEESLDEDWHCPRCTQPCHCPAYLMHTPIPG